MFATQRDLLLYAVFRGSQVNLLDYSQVAASRATVQWDLSIACRRRLQRWSSLLRNRRNNARKQQVDISRLSLPEEEVDWMMVDDKLKVTNHFVGCNEAQIYLKRCLQSSCSLSLSRPSFSFDQKHPSTSGSVVYLSIHPSFTILRKERKSFQRR